MFARHTPTRMKGSGVVQGLKSLASKLHPQLPLSAKESQRLLTALTSSFRQHLDVAHPPRGSNGDARPTQNDGGPLQSGTHGLHSSSAAFADKHLASVLTNPLLSRPNQARKPVLDYATAKVELHKNSARDPIALLEEYHEKGASSIPIAILCLESFQRSLDNLSPDNRRKEVVQTEAGKRMLLWLWKSKLYETDAFVDDKRLIDMIVPIVIEEGFEDYLWDWLKLDMQLGSQEQAGMQLSLGSEQRRKAYRYRWKGYALRGMVAAKLEEKQNGSIDAALDTFFKACDLRIELTGHVEDSRLPLFPAAMALQNALTKPQRKRYDPDPARFDRFVRSVGYVYTSPSFRRFHEGILQLYHPRTPSPLPLLAALRVVFSSDSQSFRETSIRKYIERPRDLLQTHAIYHYLIEAAVLLQDGAYTQDADWILSLIHRHYPEMSPWVEQDMRKRKKVPKGSSTSDERIRASEGPVPFPTFV